MYLLRDYALAHIGLKYKWGGDDPIGGYDCSGFVIELLQSVGLLPHGFDTTAQGLYNHFEDTGIHNSYGVGALVFYGKSVLKITHVGMLLENTYPYRMIEAGGGNSQVKTSQDAEDHNAYIRIRPVDYRKDRRAVIKPYFYDQFG